MNLAEHLSAQGPTRREVLRAMGMMAGTAVLYQAMEVLGHAKETQFGGPPNLQGARPGTRVVVLGAGLAGMIGPESSIFAIVGGALMFGGAVIVLLSRHKLSQVENRRGDLN